MNLSCIALKKNELKSFDGCKIKGGNYSIDRVFILIEAIGHVKMFNLQKGSKLSAPGKTP